jgi:hypothetical protein
MKYNGSKYLTMVIRSIMIPILVVYCENAQSEVCYKIDRDKNFGTIQKPSKLGAVAEYNS